jgi:hypothetical protein
VSGLDDCALGLICWDVDPQTLQGACVSMCEGSEGSPTCTDPAAVCNLLNDGVLNLCLATCDPLVQNCPGASEACYPVATGFTCAPDASGTEGGYGEPCELGVLNTCDPGRFCAPAENMPSCDTTGCCSTFCDLTQNDPNSQCPEQAQGQMCLPASLAISVPPGMEHVGFCAIPP